MHINHSIDIYKCCIVILHYIVRRVQVNTLTVKIIED